jgi:hypothetical protein
MFRLNRALLALTLGLVVVGGVSAALAQQPAGQAPPKAVWINPVRGTVEIQYIDTAVKMDKEGYVVKTFQVKNMSTGPIARLKIEQFWWDKNNNPVPGDAQFLKKPLMPGETGTIVLKTPKNANMFRDNYKFSHQYGDVKVKKVAKFE